MYKMYMCLWHEAVVQACQTVSTIFKNNNLLSFSNFFREQTCKVITRFRKHAKTLVRINKHMTSNNNIINKCNNTFSPLVEEKLDLEGEAMSSIQNKQDETNDELRSTLERLQATEMKTAAAQGKASQERGLIKQDVDVVRNELNAVR